MTHTTTAFQSARLQRADVFAASGDDQRTAVLALHGGGWRQGSPEMVHSRCQALSERGFTVVAVEYRLLGEARWPAPLDDVRAAVDWARSNADELGVEPDRIALQGYSAGAHLALLAAYTGDPSVAAVSAFYPPLAIFPEPAPADAIPFRVPLGPGGQAPAWMLVDDSEDEQLARTLSPIEHVSATCPPTMLVHGTADPVVSFEASVGLHRALLDVGVPVDLHLYHGASHNFDVAPSMTEVVQDEAARFYRRTVSQRGQIAEELANADMFRRYAAAGSDPAAITND